MNVHQYQKTKDHQKYDSQKPKNTQNPDPHQAQDPLLAHLKRAKSNPRAFGGLQIYTLKRKPLCTTLLGYTCCIPGCTATKPIDSNGATKNCLINLWPDDNFWYVTWLQDCKKVFGRDFVEPENDAERRKSGICELHFSAETDTSRKNLVRPSGASGSGSKRTAANTKSLSACGVTQNFNKNLVLRPDMALLQQYFEENQSIVKAGKRVENDCKVAEEPVSSKSVSVKKRPRKSVLDMIACSPSRPQKQSVLSPNFCSTPNALRPKKKLLTPAISPSFTSCILSDSDMSLITPKPRINSNKIFDHDFSDVSSENGEDNAHDQALIFSESEAEDEVGSMETSAQLIFECNNKVVGNFSKRLESVSQKKSRKRKSCAGVRNSKDLGGLVVETGGKSSGKEALGEAKAGIGPGGAPSKKYVKVSEL